MTMPEFVRMLKTIEREEKFSVGFQLQYSDCGGLTLQQLVGHIHPTTLYEFFLRVEKAESPTYFEEVKNEERDP